MDRKTPVRLPIEEILAVARKAKWLMHREDMEWLCQMARLAPKGDAVELGVYLGSSLIALSLAREGMGTVTGVDNWSYRDIDHLYDRCRNNLELAGVTPQLLTGSTLDTSVIGAMPPEGIAFLFVDADHTQSGIEGDIREWTPKVIKEGIAVFHDYGRHKNGCYVTEAIDHWQSIEGNQWTRLGLVGTTIGFRRK